MDTQEIGTFASSLPKNAKRVRVHFWFSLLFCWIRFLYVGCSHLPSCLVFIPYVLCNIQCIRRLKMEEKEERNIRRVNREKRESGRYEEKMKRRTTSRRWRKKGEEKKRGKKANDEEEGDSLRGQRWREKENKVEGRRAEREITPTEPHAKPLKIRKKIQCGRQTKNCGMCGFFTANFTILAIKVNTYSLRSTIIHNTPEFSFFLFFLNINNSFLFLLCLFFLHDIASSHAFLWKWYVLVRNYVFFKILLQCL